MTNRLPRERGSRLRKTDLVKVNAPVGLDGRHHGGVPTGRGAVEAPLPVRKKGYFFLAAFLAGAFLAAFFGAAFFTAAFLAGAFFGAAFFTAAFLAGVFFAAAFLAGAFFLAGMVCVWLFSRSVHHVPGRHRRVHSGERLA